MMLKRNVQEFMTSGKFITRLSFSIYMQCSDILEEDLDCQQLHGEYVSKRKGLEKLPDESYRW